MTQGRGHALPSAGKHETLHSSDHLSCWRFPQWAALHHPAGAGLQQQPAPPPSSAALPAAPAAGANPAWLTPQPRCWLGTPACPSAVPRPLQPALLLAQGRRLMGPGQAAGCVPERQHRHARQLVPPSACAPPAVPCPGAGSTWKRSAEADWCGGRLQRQHAASHSTVVTVCRPQQPLQPGRAVCQGLRFSVPRRHVAF